MLKNKIKRHIAALALILLSSQAIALPTALAANYLPVRAYATDTVAGYATSMRTSLIKAGQDVVFVVERPDFSVVRVPAKADLEGVAQADLYGHQTKTSGTYRLAVVYPGSPDSSPQNTFTVYPDQASVTQSSVTSTRQMIAADGQDKSFVTITLYDSYRNPISNHQIKLISSRQDDSVEAISGGVTDREGRANFKISSRHAGVSVLTAMDATLGQVLTDREEIVFFEAKKEKEGFGGNFFSGNLLGAQVTGAQDSGVTPGPVDSFEIVDLPSSVKVNTDQTLTVIARDANGNTAKNYTGTILFSTPDDDNAVLPGNGEYTFKESDLGKFTFNLALRFTQTGNQTVQVFDKDNWRISGEKDMEVVSQNVVNNPQGNGKLAIKSPLDGAELGSSLVILTGQGEPNVNLKVFDNDIKIGDSETDSDGFFTFEARNLLSGSHTFYVMSNQGDISPSTSVFIDTVPPVLNQIFVDPQRILVPGESIRISIGSEADLDDASIRLQGITEALLPSGDPGNYSATIAAPSQPGTYPIDVILVDGLANKSELLNQKTIQVQAALAEAPPVVQGFDGVAGDGEVTLMWEEIEDHTETIEKYRITYGEDFAELNKKAETQGPTGTFTVTGLENGKQYYFAVAAVDSKGTESEEPSVTLALKPEPLNPIPVDNGDDDNQIPIDMGDDTFVRGVSGDNSVTLSWEPFPGVQAYYYKALFGLQSGQYDDYAVTIDNQPNITIRDLINDIPYHFAIVALDINGKEISPLSTEFSVVPTGSGFHSYDNGVSMGQGGYHQAPGSNPYNPPLSNDKLGNVPRNGETGPESLWLIVFSIFAAHFFYAQTKRLIRAR